ncbi:MAG: hypothetical protein IPK88_03545 [Saprospiraceae bacterium]|uniref:Uncharacterized protein n=1 Tax=Candidatus Defluviibacterium haderslevense TaxID=2981993 RepID=A0A9D7S8Y8_9BACT|nr:hypothetical protein [Candidatus Defluviibacterium haderslevense]MBK8242475.1 hypothetical protein [Candidatus Defluviibacterium haderslevense]MBK9716929.1 hypothetical protein [Candidatus Defluviibacterium haderslevense]MBL0236159.1 hypothetical protein [Candidatus Defluviibacterium haderslevense]MCI1267042.1 hypothetical protein [Saprospiraceae bacterium]
MILFALFISSLISCHEDTLSTRFNYQTKQEWVVGADIDSVNKTMTVPANTRLNIEVTSESLCKSSGIEIIISNASTILFQKTVSVFPFSETITIDQAQDLNIQTKVKIVNTAIECIWLGNANVIVGY